jgi:hypothetical protein
LSIERCVERVYLTLTYRYPVSSLLNNNPYVQAHSYKQS